MMSTVFYCLPNGSSSKGLYFVHFGDGPDNKHISEGNYYPNYSQSMILSNLQDNYSGGAPMVH